MKKFLLAALCAALPCIAFAQVRDKIRPLSAQVMTNDTSIRPPIDLRLGRGLLQTTDGREIKFEQLEVRDRSFFYKPSGNKTWQDITAGNTFQVIRKKGSWAGEMALLGGLSALLGALQGINDASSYGDIDAGKAGRLTVGITLGGAALGGLLGSAIPKYKKVWRNAVFNK